MSYFQSPPFHFSLESPLLTHISYCSYYIDLFLFFLHQLLARLSFRCSFSPAHLPLLSLCVYPSFFLPRVFSSLLLFSFSICHILICFCLSFCTPLFMSVFFFLLPSSLSLCLNCPICWSICVYVFALITV